MGLGKSIELQFIQVKIIGILPPIDWDTDLR